MSTKVIRACVVLGVYLLNVPATSAQTNSSIAGTVTDATRAVLPGVTVEASSPALIDKVRSAVTDGAGRYRIIELVPGMYTLTFSLPGFTTAKRGGLELTTGFTATVNAELQTGAIEETVTVKGESPVVDTQKVVQQRVVTRDVIEAIPTGKVYANLAALIPGIMLGGIAREQDVGGSAGSNNQSLSIHGGRNFDQRVTVDGANIGQSEVGGPTSMSYPEGSTQEINIQTGGHSAEFETGGVQVNIVPKSGGNAIRGYVAASFTNEHLQSDNLSDAIRVRGLNLADRVKNIFDINPTVGGPLLQDRLWFYLGYRNWQTNRYSTSFYNTDPAGWVYTPDTRRGPVPLHDTNKSGSLRLTWQATPKNTINTDVYSERRCNCEQFFSPLVALEATSEAIYPSRLFQTTWQSPVTNQWLLEAGAAMYLSQMDTRPQATVFPPSAIELGTGIEFRARESTPQSLNEAYPRFTWNNHTVRGSASYVTGAHHFKAGGVINPQTDILDRRGLSNYQVLLLDGRPIAVNYISMPYRTTDNIRAWALFAQDQWTMRRLTLSSGLRFDRDRTYYPDVTLPVTEFFPQRSFSGATVLDWKDISPRMGASFDLFGDAKTAVKVSLGRYVVGHYSDIIHTRAADPTYATGFPNQRTWNNVAGDFIPHGDPLNPLPNGELGPSSNLNFGKPIFTTKLDPDWTNGWGKREFNWEMAASIQHELVPRVSLTGGYFRRWHGNFWLDSNLAVGPSDFRPFCITAPQDSQLPGGGGYPICGLYDVDPSKFGQINNFRTLASNYGKQYERWQGVDATINARLPNGAILQGGLATGGVVTDRCDVVSKNPQLLGAGNPLEYCHLTQPWLTQLKFLGSYRLPGQIDVAATFQSIPLTSYYGTLGPSSFGVSAFYVATNAVVAPSLGRDLASGRNGTVAVNLIKPGTMLPERTNQLDLRIARTFTFGGTRLKGIVDLYNVLNANPVLTWNNTYGTTGKSWLVPTQILQARLLKFAVQLDF